MTSTALLPLVVKIVEMGSAAVRSLSPIRVEVGMGNLPLTFTVRIGNRSKEAVKVRSVRVHYGARNYNSFFQLVPYEETSIGPKDLEDFKLPYNDNLMGKRFQAKRPPNWLNQQDSPAPWESPANLFLAIANGNPLRSWVEVDFDLVECRRYALGRIGPIFDSIRRCSPLVESIGDEQETEEVYSMLSRSLVADPTALSILLPRGEMLAIHNLELSLRAVMVIASKFLGDEKICPKHFGTRHHFFLVNRSTGMLIDDNVPVTAPLARLKMQLGQVIELCCPSAWPRDGKPIPNPMYGVVSFLVYEPGDEGKRIRKDGLHAWG
jgi:hypothetical protein